MKFFVIFFLIPLTLFADATLKLRPCNSDEERTWGLMNCKFLPDNEGMLFTFDEPKIQTFWMFNCQIDLSIAFVDEKNIIREIHEMKAYPQMMDKKRAVNSQKDLALYPNHDPIVLFYRMMSTSSKANVKYAIEANRGWFNRNHVEVGDTFVMNESEAVFVHQ